METLSPTFFILVGAGDFGMRAQIVSKGKVALNLRRVRLEKVKLHDADSLLVVESAVPSSRDAELTVPPIPELLDAPSQPIQLRQFAHERHQIDDRLGRQSRHRRGADMMNN